MNRWTGNRTTRHICASVIAFVFLLTAVARAEIKAIQPLGEGDRTWLVCTDVAADKNVTTIVRRLADPLKGVWIESLRLGGRYIDAAALDDRIALLSEDGTWRVAWDAASVGGPKPPDGYTLRKFASDGRDTLWAIADGPRGAASLLKWREQDGWSVVQSLPAGVTANTVAIGVVAGEPWIAIARPQALRLMKLAPAGWQEGPTAEVLELSANDVIAFIPGSEKPLLAAGIGGANLVLIKPGPPQIIKTLPQMGDALLAGPVLKLFHLKDGKIEQTTIDEGGFGQPFGKAAVPDPARPLPPRGEWVSPLVLAILTILTLRALRPRADEPESVAGSLTAAPIVRRFAAVIIDAGPCVAIGVWAYSAFGGAIEDTPRSGLPMVLASYLSLLGYLAHVAACEVAFGRSAGKWLMGLRVVSVDGTRATAGQIVMRNLLRLLEIQLFLPMFIVLMTPTGQRLGDLAARTIVTIDAAGDRAGTVDRPESDVDAD